MSDTPSGAAVVIECSRWFDGTAMHTGRQRVVVRDGRIAAVGPDATIPAGATRIELPANATLMPGLIDAHTHLGYAWEDTTKPPDLTGAYLGLPAAVAYSAAHNARGADESAKSHARVLGQAQSVQPPTTTSSS